MMMHEFTERTGYEPSQEEYDLIEQSYYDFNGDKDEFCKAWVKAHKSGAWEREAELLAVIAGLKEANKNLADKLQEANDLLGKAGHDRDYFHQIANGLAKDVEGMESRIHQLEHCWPQMMLDEEQIPVKSATLVWNDGKPFLTIERPNGFTQSYYTDGLRSWKMTIDR